jgi:putative peptide zinc metalloprotease protein
VSRFLRGAIVAVTGAVLAAGPVAAAVAQDNAAVAVNTKDGTSVFKLAFSVRRVMGDVVDESNAAVAYASCDSCQTVAVAIQVVLVMSDPSVVTPTNVAIAINEGCTACETLASAVQYVLGVGGPVHFTAAGNQALAELRQELRDLLSAGLSVEELAPALEDLTSRLADILGDELVSVGDAPQPDATATPPATTPTAEPTPADETPAPEGSAVEPAEETSTTTPPPAPSSSETAPAPSHSP